ncbi:glycine cleavage system aminomethyltransferase GcvT [Candidatus Bathyarchaeota archaeon]|nr:glycine cleavage system aminomethyltransferase GcvT [Candidatus Bathyarchaeota archaeon]
MSEKTRRVQLHEIHKQTAKLTSFAGYEMPLYYKGILQEHLVVRNSAGLFDISHMGRIIVEGTDSEPFLNHVVTNDVSRLLPNNAQYSVMCKENGGIIDDFVIYRLDVTRFLVVFNASNREKDHTWLVRNAKGFNVRIEDVSDNVAMLAVQGPNAARILQELSTEDLSKIERFKCDKTRLAGVESFLARTGYTGEDGFEIFVWDATLAKPDNALKVWKTTLESAKSFEIEPCGLGARDTLRLEAGLCLYGNDINENINPLEAGLGFVVKLQKTSFIGKEALQNQKNEGLKRKRVGIILTEQGVPRPGFEILNDKDETIGHLTSGTFSPLLKRGIGMGYTEPSKAQEGNIVKIRIREKQMRAKIAAFPLYDAEKYGYKRKTAM